MSVHILSDGSEQACLFCSTSGVAFGPVFRADKASGRDAYEQAETFLQWCYRVQHTDPRAWSDAELMAKYSEWLTAQPEIDKQTAAEEEVLS